MKKVLLLLALLGVVACRDPKPVPAERLYFPAGGFSYVTPDGWFRTKLAGVDFIVVSMDVSFGIKPNIYVEFAEASADLSAVVKKQLETSRKDRNSYAVVRQEEFQIESGLIGKKVTATCMGKDRIPLAVYHYFACDNQKVIAITCICADPVKDQYEPAFDEAMRSLAIGAKR